MKKATLFFFLLAGWLLACQTKPDNQSGENQNLQEIEQLEEQILKAGDASQEREQALELVEKTMQFAAQYPHHERTPELLFKAADIARGAKAYGKAVQLWGKLWRNYGDHPKAPMALFLQGFTFDSDLQDASMAKKYYREFLVTFPNDSLATQVQQLLSVVEVSPDELVKQFEQQQ